MINYDLKIFRILDLDQQLIRLVNSISKNCHQSDKAAENVDDFRYRFPLDCPTPVGIDADSKSEHPKRLQNLFQRRFRLEISFISKLPCTIIFINRIFYGANSQEISEQTETFLLFFN